MYLISFPIALHLTFLSPITLVSLQNSIKQISFHLQTFVLLVSPVKHTLSLVIKLFVPLFIPSFSSVHSISNFQAFHFHQTTQVSQGNPCSTFPYHLLKLMLNPAWAIKPSTNLQEAIIRYLLFLKQLISFTSI